MSGEAEGLLIGIEVHQQLRTESKLFCACPPLKSEELPFSFERRLRPSQSEVGKLDAAAVFEFAKGRRNRYFWNPESACLVEADEEPPHALSGGALDATLMVATALGSNIVDEVHVMRKIVIDGSNTTGFQRTAVVGLGGSFNVDGQSVGVQTVTVEEDAARILGDDLNARNFSLDRLGVPLVEIALAPVSGGPASAGKVALALGRTLRSTGRVARGLGTIRQDLNVSYRGGKVVEVKGVQKLNLVAKVVDYERRRQSGLFKLAQRLKEAKVTKVECGTMEVTATEGGSGSKVVAGAVASGGVVFCIRASGLAGLLGWEPESGVRLGREVAEVARGNLLGGIIHSDEFRKVGISEQEESGLRQEMAARPGDALILLAGPRAVVEAAVPAVVSRLQGAVRGVPAETRAATDEGETRYMRPRPGSQRMYPETDIGDIEVTTAMKSAARKGLPPGWSDTISRLRREYSLSEDLALRVYDSDATEAFEQTARKAHLEPSVVASMLIELPVRLAREGLADTYLTPEVVAELVVLVSEGRVAKEAAPEVLRAAATKGVRVGQAIEMLGLRSVEESEVDAIIDSVVANGRTLILERRENAFSPLMGEVMKEVRGKVDGAVVGKRLREKLENYLRAEGPEKKRPAGSP